MKPVGEGDVVPEVLGESVVDRRLYVDVDAGLEMSKRLAARGIFVGSPQGRT